MNEFKDRGPRQIDTGGRESPGKSIEFPDVEKFLSTPKQSKRGVQTLYRTNSPGSGTQIGKQNLATDVVDPIEILDIQIDGAQPENES